MRRQGRWRRVFLARLGVELGLLLLIATAANVPLGLLRLRSRTETTTFKLVSSSDPTLEQWVWTPPKATGVWPRPERWAAAKEMGLSYYHITSGDYAMQVQFAGFPFPVVAEPQMWWNWKLVRSGLDCQPDPGVQVLWLGVFLNPPILAAGSWALLVAPFEVFFSVRLRRRLNQRLCPFCAYPEGGTEVCTECGRRAIR